MKLKQVKLDGRVFSLQFHRNCKNNLFKGNLESENFSQLWSLKIMRYTNKQVILT